MNENYYMQLVCALHTQTHAAPLIILLCIIATAEISAFKLHAPLNRQLKTCQHVMYCAHTDVPTYVCRWLQSPEILVAGIVGLCMHHSSVTMNLATPVAMIMALLIKYRSLLCSPRA